MDITHLLESWQYDPEDSVRLIRAADGRELMQVRLPLGIEQYELDDRPDGARPFGRPTMVNEIEHRLEEHLRLRGEEKGFTIDHESFDLLQAEGLLFYYRYVTLFQIGDYARAARDTAHNLTLCSLVEKFRHDRSDRDSLLQYRPYIIRINALSRSMIALDSGDQEEAAAIIEDAIETVHGLAEIDTTVFRIERMRSLSHLQETLEQVRNQSVSEVDRLEAELAAAIDSENYERAAEIRDTISALLESEAHE